MSVGARPKVSLASYSPRLTFHFTASAPKSPPKRVTSRVVRLCQTWPRASRSRPGTVWSGWASWDRQRTMYMDTSPTDCRSHEDDQLGGSIQSDEDVASSQALRPRIAWCLLSRLTYFGPVCPEPRPARKPRAPYLQHAVERVGRGLIVHSTVRTYGTCSMKPRTFTLEILKDEDETAPERAREKVGYGGISQSSAGP